MTDSLPLFPLGTVLFPGMILPLHIFEQRYRTLMRRRMHDNPIFGVVLTRKGREVGEEPEIHHVGTAASLLKAARYPDGRFDITVRGGRRFRVLAGEWSAGYLTAEIAWIDESYPAAPPGMDRQGQLARLLASFEDFLDVLEEVTGESIDRDEIAGLGDDPVQVGYAICTLMAFSTALRQRLLEAQTPQQFLDELVATLRRDRQLLRTTGAGAAIDYPGRQFSTN